MRAQLLRGGVGVGATMVAGLVAALVAAVLMARAMGPADLGTYAIAMAIIALTTLPIESGLPALVGREVARAQALADWGGMAAVLRFADRAALTMGAAILAGLYLVLWVWGKGGPTAQALVPAVLLVPVVVYGNIRAATLIGLRRVTAGTFATDVVRPAGLALVVALYLALGVGPLTPALAVAMQVPPALAAWALAAWQVRRHLPGEVGRATPAPGDRAWARMTVRLGLTRGLRVGDGHVMTLMVGALGGPAAAGFLRIALRGSELAALGHKTVVTLLGPHLTRLDAIGDRARLQRLLTRAAQVMTVLQLGTLAVFAVWGEWLIVALFGAEYRPALAALIVLAAVHLVRAVFGPTAILMNSLRREGAYLVSLAIKIAVGVGLGAGLIRGFGAEGAALSLLVGSAVQAVYLWRVARGMGLRPTALGI